LKQSLNFRLQFVIYNIQFEGISQTSRIAQIPPSTDGACTLAVTDGVKGSLWS
jgi:hypothetical protein